jgi:hypothetical protein
MAWRECCQGRTMTERARLAVVDCGVNDSVSLLLVDEE